MLVHNVTIGKGINDQNPQGKHKIIYVGCAESDIQYRDMMVDFKQRWAFYANNTFDFLTSDRSGLESEQWKQFAEKKIRKSDGAMIIVSERTASDPGADWEINCALSSAIPTVGVDIRKNPDAKLPEKLVGKMTRYGWEWIAGFIDSL